MFLYSQNKKVAAIGMKVNDEEEYDSDKEKDIDQIKEFVSNMPSQTSRDNFYLWVNQNYGTMELETLTGSQLKAILKKILGRAGR